MYKDVIGIVGGMGSYATLSFFERLLDAFPAEKEWDRPRILIDNRCTMPSRVRAILYNEKADELAEELTDSVKHLIKAGATKIVLACNTSHYFIPEIYKRLPAANGKIVSIIEATADKIFSIVEQGECVNLLASEGTIDIRIFHTILEKRGIKVLTPTGEEYAKQREIIEAVKQKKITDKEIHMFKDLINAAESDFVIIGCTEFPVVYALLNKSTIVEKTVIDPLQCVIDQLMVELN